MVKKWLDERTRCRSQGATSSSNDGPDWVLYWMRTAMRGHDNPALDKAVELANAQGLSVLVYQYLSPDGPYPYPSDRHYRFVLEGARDVAMELEQRGIAYAFEVADRAMGALPELVGRAHSVVVEDLPIKWHRCGTEGATSSSDGAVYEVDTACVVPRYLVGGYRDRAYKFRDVHRPLREERIHRRWEPVEPAVEPTPTDGLPFEPLEWEGVDVGEVVSSMDIDHSVGPVGDTPGGSAAAYGRWRAFRDENLAYYDKVRNDAARPQGVSRLSAYLHYGQISPFRVARQAAAMDGDGPAKYIDEMVTWREFAHHVCAQFESAPGVDWLPPWARETLKEHESDERPAIYDWEQIARGKTDDELWNLCQQSLLAHGELHNNLRMTWGKRFVEWTETIDQAVEMAVDLNDRYALDGSDPNSYLGILWCFGGWDRPFKPEKPIIGTTRPRSSERHANRLNMTRYRQWVERPPKEPPPKVGVVGAGLAGLMAARILHDHGLEVSVVDKGRKPGGRSSTRRSREGLQFDHGAQYFTARSDWLRRYVNAWVEQGVVAPFEPTLAVVDEDGWRLKEKATQRFVGRPSMDAVADHLAVALDINCDVEVSGLNVVKTGEIEMISGGCRTLGAYDAVILTPPGPQVSALCRELDPGLSTRIDEVEFQPTWAVMVAFESELELEAQGIFVNGEGPLGWVCRDGSKAGRSGTQSWVLHGSAVWSASHVEDESEEVASALVEAFREVVEAGGGKWSEPMVRRAHRWRYARAAEPLEEGALVSQQVEGLVVAGDWLCGSRIEGALKSGAAAAGRILNGGAGDARGAQPGLWDG